MDKAGKEVRSCLAHLHLPLLVLPVLLPIFRRSAPEQMSLAAWPREHVAGGPASAFPHATAPVLDGDVCQGLRPRPGGL